MALNSSAVQHGGFAVNESEVKNIGASRFEQNTTAIITPSFNIDTDLNPSTIWGLNSAKNPRFSTARGFITLIGEYQEDETLDLTHHIE